MMDRPADKGYYEIERFMADHEILLAYRDQINEDTVQHILTLTEARLSSVLNNKKFRKRVFLILVECLQNVVNHAHPTAGGARSSILLLGRGVHELFIITGNVINNDQLDALRVRLDDVNSVETDQIREAYSERLREAAFSLKGGAGLGLMDMYRRSGNKLHYEFMPIPNTATSFFTMRITVNIGDEVVGK